MHVGKTNFSFVTENLRIFKIFTMKITILGKMKNFKITFHKNKLHHWEDRKKVDISHANEWYEFRSQF